MVFVGLLCGIAAACCGRGQTRRLLAVMLGIALGVIVAGIEWLVCVLWAARGSQVPVDAWASGRVHLWAILLVALLAIVTAMTLLSIRTRDLRLRTEQGPTARAVGRLAKAVPRAVRAALVVCAVSAVLTALAARATSSSTFEFVSRTVTAAVDVVWP